MIDAVLFDVGGVIFASPLAAFTAYERERGLPGDFITGVLRRNPHDNAWARHERGQISNDDFMQLFETEARDAGQEIDARALVGLIQGEVRPEFVEAMRRIHARGLPIALLTNNFPGADGLGSLRRGGIEEVTRLADVIVESSQVGLRKPELAFYQLACSRLGIEPRQAVFLDDLGANLKPARELGMTTIKVDDPHRALRELAELLGFSLLDDAAIQAG